MKVSRTLGALAGAIAVFGAGAVSFAEDDGWNSKLGLGLLATSGNSETSSLNVYGETNYSTGRWHHRFRAVAASAEADSQTTAERYEAGYKTKYDFREFDYFFGALRYEKDKFSGVDEQSSELVGYGRRLIENDVHKWNAEIGFGAKQSDLRDGTSQDETIIGGSTDYRWHFSESGKFGQDFSFEIGDDNTYLESVTSVSATLVNQLALVASYTIKHNTDVPDPTENTDTFTSISLEYAF